MKFCAKCGSSIDDASRFCSVCGTDTMPRTVPAAPNVLPPPSPLVNAPTSGKALASLILGICGFFFSILTGIPAIVLGHLAHAEIRRSVGRLQGEGMALAGLILGYVSVVFIPMILIIAAIAIPNLLRSRMVANEAAAAASLRTICMASATYQQIYGHGFPPSLAALGPDDNGAPASAEHAGLIDANLALGSKSGYVFTYQAISTHKDGTLDGFQAYADPVAPGTTGVRHFFVDQTGVIRIQEDGPANENSPPLQ